MIKTILLVVLICVSVSCFGHDRVYMAKEEEYLSCKCSQRGKVIYIRRSLLEGGKIHIETNERYVVIEILTSTSTLTRVKKSTSTEATK